jgi:hypothetical protein
MKEGDHSSAYLFYQTNPNWNTATMKKANKATLFSISVICGIYGFNICQNKAN